MIERLKPNQINRAANVAIAHGVFIHGIYREHGVPRPPKEKFSKGTILFRRLNDRV